MIFFLTSLTIPLNMLNIQCQSITVQPMTILSNAQKKLNKLFMYLKGGNSTQITKTLD